jgi:hypothetical protein
VPGTIKPIDDKTVYEMPTSTGANRKMRRVGTLEFTLKGQPLKLTAFNELGTEPSLAVCRLRRPDERHRNLRGRAASWTSSAHHRDLRSRLQPRLHPLLLLQPDLRVSLPAAGEPAEDSGSRRRAHQEA